MSDPLAKIREQLKAGKAQPAAKTTFYPTTYTGTAPTRATTAQAADVAAINPHQLDALYARGTQSVVGSNSHYAGLRAVYEAGAKDIRE